MTPASLDLLRQCAARTIVMRSTSEQWEAAEELIRQCAARIDWTMRGNYAGLAITDWGRSVLEDSDVWTSNATN